MAESTTTEAWQQIENWANNNTNERAALPPVIKDQLERLFRHLQDGEGRDLKLISWEAPELVNGHVLQNGPTELYAMYAYNDTSTAAYVKLYDDGTNDSNGADTRYVGITNPGSNDRVVFMQMFPSIRFVDGLVVTGHSTFSGTTDANHIRGFVIVGA